MAAERSSELALERRFPALHGCLPRVPLTALPTRVHRLANLARELGVAALWVKRDDESGPLYGGNKPRKLEFLLGAARAAGRRTVLTFGGTGTHHGLATAVCARALGMRTILVLLRQPVTEHVRRCLLLDHAAGAELHYAPTLPGVVARAVVVYARETLRGNRPAVIPTGGTSALGALGYVNAACELQEQIAAGDLPEPRWIFVPLGSGGTVAGLVLGAKLAGLRARVVGVLVTDILAPSPRTLARCAAGTLALLRRLAAEIPQPALSAADFVFVRDQVGSGYGAPTEAARRARDLLRDQEHIVLETTYTAKCLAAMLEALRMPAYADGPVLFWNTYSSVDPAAHLGGLPDYRQLPRSFHRCFSGTVVAA